MRIGRCYTPAILASRSHCFNSQTSMAIACAEYYFNLLNTELHPLASSPPNLTCYTTVKFDISEPLSSLLCQNYNHSTVYETSDQQVKANETMQHKHTLGGLDEISYVTRFMPGTSFVIRDDMRLKTSGGNTYLFGNYALVSSGSKNQ